MSLRQKQSTKIDIKHYFGQGPVSVSKWTAVIVSKYSALVIMDIFFFSLEKDNWPQLENNGGLRTLF